MFAFRDHLDLDPGPARVEIAFTDASLDLRDGVENTTFDAHLAALVDTAGVPFARLDQVHGSDVTEVVEAPDLDRPSAVVASADALLTRRDDIGLMIRVADCVPVLLACASTGVLAAAHAGRLGMAAGVVPNTVRAMRERDATDIRAWIGPHVCGRCYEVPDEMRAEVAAAVPQAHADTRQGTPALDLGAGVRAQLEDAGVVVADAGGCTLEDQGLHSHRRDGDRSGRLAGLVWRR